jgi:hypothetical protein
MGVNLVVIVENVKGLSQEEVNEALGVYVFEYEDGRRGTVPRWELFEWKGRVYATWNFTPRIFEGIHNIFAASLYSDPWSEIDENTRILWESLRKYLAKVRKLLGNGKVYLGNDLTHIRSPKGLKKADEVFLLPPEVPEKLLEEPCLNKYPELKNVKELQLLTW